MDPVAVFMTIDPNWRGYWTIQHAEQVLPGFKFQGAGWYILGEGKTVTLVQRYTDDVYLFCQWYDMDEEKTRELMEAFRWVTEAPVFDYFYKKGENQL